ncbi:Hypothetical protein FKW44_004509 [Caligus rogercresseyi]|uniref:Uncharacterized protein n=1 Tax=Caligus rogercresseyi TaxID=217165 RepID=A0A7T8HLQ2_CALRO|nr:Hypothetical protein FKW44_004509 [Caligus rogercresseyi]
MKLMQDQQEWQRTLLKVLHETRGREEAFRGQTQGKMLYTNRDINGKMPRKWMCLTSRALKEWTLRTFGTGGNGLKTSLR